MDTTALYRPVGRTGQVYSQVAGTWVMHSYAATAWAVPGELAAHGDTYTERWDRFTRATTLGRAWHTYSGLNANITIMAEVRYTQQYEEPGAATWSAWLSADAVTMSAVVLDPTKPTWVEWRYTRQDLVADPAVVKVLAVKHEVPVDLTQPAHAGVVVLGSLHGDLEAVVEAIAMQCSPQQPLGTVATRPWFQFFPGHPDKCVADGRPVVYLYRVDVQDRQRNADLGSRVVQFRVGLKRECSAPRPAWNEMRSALKERFGLNAQAYQYEVALHGVLNLHASLSQLGVRDVRTFADTEVEVGSCGCTRWEMAVEGVFAFELVNDLLL